jgi:hypothetical protein
MSYENDGADEATEIANTIIASLAYEGLRDEAVEELAKAIGKALAKKAAKLAMRVSSAMMRKIVSRAATRAAFKAAAKSLAKSTSKAGNIAAIVIALVDLAFDIVDPYGYNNLIDVEVAANFTANILDRASDKLDNPSYDLMQDEALIEREKAAMETYKYEMSVACIWDGNIAACDAACHDPTESENTNANCDPVLIDEAYKNYVENMNLAELTDLDLSTLPPQLAAIIAREKEAMKGTGQNSGSVRNALLLGVVGVGAMLVLYS